MAISLGDIFRDRAKQLAIKTRGFGDNTTANLIKYDIRKVRHIALADLWIREVTGAGEIVIEDVPSDKNRGMQRLQGRLSHLNLTD